MNSPKTLTNSQLLTPKQNAKQEQFVGTFRTLSTSSRASPISSYDLSQTTPSVRIHIQGDQSPNNKSLAASIAEKLKTKDRFANKPCNLFIKQKSANEMRASASEQKKFWLKANIASPSSQKSTYLFKNNFAQDFMKETDLFSQNEDTRDTLVAAKRFSALALEYRKSEGDRAMPKSASNGTPTSSKNQRVGATMQKSQHFVQSRFVKEQRFDRNSRGSSSKVIKDEGKKNQSPSNRYQNSLDLKKARSFQGTAGWDFNDEDEDKYNEKDKDNQNDDNKNKRAGNSMEQINILDNENLQNLEAKHIKLQDLQKQTEMDQKTLKDLQDQLSELQKLSVKVSGSSRASPYLSYIKAEDETLDLSPKSSATKWQPFEKEDVNSEKHLIEMLKNEIQTLKHTNKYLMQYKEAAKKYRDIAKAKDEECLLLAQEVAQLREKLGLPPRENLPKSPMQILSPTGGSSPKDNKTINNKCFTSELEAYKNENEKIAEPTNQVGSNNI